MPKTRIPIKDFLANLPLFREVVAAGIDRLALKTTEVDAPRETIVCRRGCCCGGLHAVVVGQVKLSVDTGRGDEKVIELVGPGMIFGEAAMFLGKPHIVSAVTLTDCKLLRVEKEAVLDEVRRDPKFAQRVIESLCYRLHQRIMDLESFALRSGTERVVDYLLCQDLSATPSGAMNITLPVKKGVIASRLNLTHEHFSRILHDLMNERLIKVEGRDVRVLDTGKLRAYCAE
ncbi:MAG: Crp/Fnr family transcriptional regulator [Burkholderiales bacterium]|nr:Crp/Fnr family transcriptional regulator [Burkholderiales bacterium]